MEKHVRKLDSFPAEDGHIESVLVGVQEVKVSFQDWRAGNEGAFTVSCGKNSGSNSPTERRIWSGNRQGGGIVNTNYRRPVLGFYLPDK